MRAPVISAILGGALVIAHQVAGKAVRDALFLSNFAVTSLPLMMIGAACLSILVVLITARAMTSLTPATLVPRVFVASALLHLAEWALMVQNARAAAVALYLHIGGLGAVLISGFWSMVNERFDPRTAKKRIGQIAAAGTAGGLAGGILAERVAAMLTLPAMLPFLAAMHLLCAWTVTGLKPAGRAAHVPVEPDAGRLGEGFQVLKQASYLSDLATLVLLGTVSATMIDYVFKARAAGTYGQGASLLRFFALFYTATSLATFIVQTVGTRWSLEKLGLSKTVGTLPAAICAGSAGALVAPGIGSAIIARAAELAIRGSLFRSGYELFYTPVPPNEKRAAKSLVDVGFDRLGDVVGSGIIRGALWLAPQSANTALLGVAFALGVAGLWAAGRLNQGYIGVLEKSLLSRAVELDIEDVQDSTTRITVVAIQQRQEARVQPETAPAALDPAASRIAELRSGSPERVRKALRQPEVLSSALLPHAIVLLAWDEVAPAAMEALHRAAAANTGQLVDALLDSEQEFAIRRRIPKVLSTCVSQRSVDGLMLGLADKRFEVRFQCARALAQLRDKGPKLRIDREKVFEAALREVAAGKHVWETQRLLDQWEETDSSPFVDEFLRDRTNRSLEHVFTILSLALPKEPLRIAFRGLHTDDDHLRGTALEYLESVLPGTVRERLWPFLEDRRMKEPMRRSQEQILADLARSNQSIELRLAELRQLDRGGARG